MKWRAVLSSALLLPSNGLFLDRGRCRISSRALVTSSPLSSASNSSGDGSLPPVTQHNYSKASEEVVFSGWRKVLRKNITFPTGNTHAFDITYQGNPSVAVFSWCSDTKTTTLIQEFHPGIEQIMYGTVAGIYERGKKHSSALDAAMAELEEEAHLRAAPHNWIPLLADADSSCPFEKYSDNRLHVFLALDCEIVPDPKPLDDEEHIVITRGVTYKQLRTLIASGRMNVPSSYTTLMALDKLKEMGLPLE